MNILVDKLPTEYKGLKINTNFRSFILFELLMQDREVSEKEKIFLSLRLFYEEPPKDIKEAMNVVLWFYSMGETEKEEKKEKNEGQINKKNIFSYDYDAKYIYSAFLSQYGVDLADIEYLHWWKFKSMFDGLNEENKICQIMGYRAIDLNKIKDKEERKRYKKLKQQWALPDNRTQEEKEKDFAEAFW